MAASTRVALDLTPAVRQGAGVGRYARRLGEALLGRGRFPYVVFVGDRVAPDEVAGFVPSPGAVIRTSPVGARALAVLWHRMGLPLPAEWWTGPVDVFHAMDFLVPPLRRAAAVVTVHDLSFLAVPDRAEPSLQRYLARAVPRSTRRAAHVLADSEHTRRDVIALLGVPAERVTVAYPGVGKEFRRVEDRAELEGVRAAHRLERPFVLGVGTIEPRKDWPTLIEAFCTRPEVRRGRDLVVAGARGWRTEATLSAVDRAGPDVRLIGPVPDRDLPALYTLADAFAYPSVYEGFGLPPLEAMACGTPTVVSDASCLPEVVGDGALAVPVGDAEALGAALARLLADTDLRGSLVERSVARARAFTWDACAAAAEAVYAAAAG